MEEQIKEIIRAFSNASVKEIKPFCSLKKDLGFDSLDTVDMVMQLERKFDISIADDALSEEATVADVIALVQNLQNDKQ